MTMLRPRGTCGFCGRELALTESHDVWRHDDPGHARRLAGAPISCRGSWTPATEAPDRIGPAQLALLAFGDCAPADVAVNGEGNRGEHDQAAVEPLALFPDASAQ